MIVVFSDAVVSTAKLKVLQWKVGVNSRCGCGKCTMMSVAAKPCEPWKSWNYEAEKQKHGNLNDISVLSIHILINVSVVSIVRGDGI